MTTLTEADVESVALEWLAALGWQTAHGPDIGPGAPGEERADYGAVVLGRRLRDALARLNPDLPLDALDDAFRKLTRPEGSVRSQGASTLRRHKATSLVVYAAASSLISECQRVRKSRRCSVNATWAPPRRRTRKYCRSSSNALQKRDADSKLPKPCIG